ncbi:MAG: hypothetical protein KDE52_06920 [Calditrichaeota bacterium]|nr:hypothetical protein [Calditrichota bacterium]MCB0267468.1 hypothetical protein [Calditrichota bacterium]MCB0286165.1 hypothetical protein [Calditrichota bacterium]MCB0299769.1 hypothetical protein [Calditrichota bacterium]MCB9067837.1 hypothetical protein [Calditrichia bacterium]
MKRAIIFLLLILGFISGCDSEKFLKYNYDAETLAKQVVITGNISNQFTLRGVENAKISFEDQFVITDYFGNYELRYQFSADADQGRAIPVRIEAENFFVLDTTQVVFPEPMTFNVKLEYAAPIIEDLAIVVPENVCQALILDYQGVENLSSVIVRLNYRDQQSGTVYTTRDVAMSYVGNHSTYTYRFQCDIPADYPVTDKGDLILLTAQDADGFSDEELHNSNPRTPDMLLFPK